ncbi:MAG: hypothetical protein KAF27_09040 [Porphyrobacter sp.]|nr:hypothetical protein [Porphyrobacter sp.]
MIALSRRRPTSITIFAAAFLAAALVAFLDGMRDLPAFQNSLSQTIPDIVWTRDAAIVTLSARLSIALIPIAMVWLSAVRFARWMVTVMVAARLLNLPEGHRFITGGGAGEPLVGPAWWAAMLLSLIAAAMLFTPASHRWFAQKGADDPAVFE